MTRTFEFQYDWISDSWEVEQPMEATGINIKKSRGRMVVQALGRTPRGQKYVKGSKVLNATSIADPKFKEEMAAAVDELLGRTA